MTNVIFNSGFIGFLIWVLLFSVSTAALQIAIRCVWGLHKTIFAMAEFKEQLIPFLFLAFALMVSLLPLRVQAALPKELPTAPAKFLPGACRTGGRRHLVWRCESLKMFKAGLDFSRNRC